MSCKHNLVEVRFLGLFILLSTMPALEGQPNDQQKQDCEDT